MTSAPACGKHWKPASAEVAPNPVAAFFSINPSSIVRVCFVTALAGLFAAPLIGQENPNPTKTTASTRQRSGVSAQVYADKAQDHFYNLEFAEAVASYKKALEIEPENPDFWTGLAHCYMFQQLQKSQQLDNQMYPASSELLRNPNATPDPVLVKLMDQALERARVICEKRIAQNDRDADAHYFLGLAYAIKGNWHFNVARQPMDALKPANRAKELHERVRELDPSNHDANLVIGTHEYAIGSVPVALRWMLRLAGYTGTKESGVKLVHDVLLNGKRGPGAALTLLTFVYHREKEYAYSRAMLGHLIRFYPRNPFFPMQVATNFLKERNPEAALEVYKDVAQKLETGAPGYTRLSAARLYYQMASVLEQQSKSIEALEYYQRASAAPPDPALGPRSNLVQASACLKMGDLHRGMKQNDEARTMYQRAAKYPFAEVRREAASRLRSIGD